MRIAIVHYHLRPGGVTRVIESARAALSQSTDSIAVLSSATIPELDYAQGAPNVRPDQLIARLVEAAQTALGGVPDVWHIHNHSLGRHPALTAACAELARRGHRLLLQIHDFPEDGRPANFRHLREALGAALDSYLYPAAPQVHYAVLNPRDRRALLAAGVPPTHLHTLPNPVSAIEPAADGTATGPRDLVLYPTRAIRRKNVGEFLLWAAVEPDAVPYALTLAPMSPADRAPYERWKAWAAQWRLPVVFEAGLQPGATLAALFARAAFVATTSVAEGFGLAFMEPWLADRPLVGRALPEITAEMEAAGLCLKALYRRLDVPRAWIDEQALRGRIETALRTQSEAYAEPLRADAAAQAWRAFINGAHVDFGRLDEPFQAQVIAQVITSPGARADLSPRRLCPVSAAAPLEANRLAVARAFGRDAYGARLRALYDVVARASTGPVGAFDAGAVRRFFLDPTRLFLLRSI